MSDDASDELTESRIDLLISQLRTPVPNACGECGGFDDPNEARMLLAAEAIEYLRESRDVLIRAMAGSPPSPTLPGGQPEQPSANLTPGAVAEIVCGAVARDPRYLDQSIVFGVTPRELMYGKIPPRWRVFARRSWLSLLRRRVLALLAEHENFTLAIRVVGCCSICGVPGGEPCDAGLHG